MAGLLDFEGMSPQDQKLANLGLLLTQVGGGIGAAGAGGASGIGQVGAGVGQGLLGYSQLQQQQQMGQLRAMQMADAKRKQEQEAARQASLGKMFERPPVQHAMAGGGMPGPTPEAQSRMQPPIAQMFPGQDVDALKNYASAFPEQFGQVMGQRLMPKTSEGFTLGEGQVRYDPSGKPIATGPAKQDEQLVKVLGPDGTVKYVRRSQAEGQAAPDEAMVVMGPDGKPMFARGGAQSVKGLVSGLTNSSQNKIEEQLIDMTAQQAQVNRIASQFRPEYQQIGTRAGLSWSTIRDKAGMNLGPEERKQVADFAKYRAEAGQYFADRLKAMSGAAVTEPEMKRQEAYLPTPGTGIFDGDSPTEFAAKTKRMQEFMTNATARLHHVSKKGMNIKDVPLDDMPRIIRSRGDQLAAEFGKRGLQGDELKATVRRQLATEFGLVSE
jgi:hypothetical protein